MECKMGRIGAGSLRAALPFMGIALLLIGEWCSDFALTFSASDSSTVFYYLPRLCAIAAFLLCALFPRFLRRLAAKQTALIALGVASGIGRALGAFAGLLPMSVGLTYTSAVLHGMGEALLLVLWFAHCCELLPRATRIVFPAAYALVACAYFIFMSLNSVIVTILIVIFPIISGLLLAHSVNQDPSEETDVVEEADSTAWTFPFLPVVLMVAYKLVFYFSLALTDGPSLYGPLGIIIISSIALLANLFFFDQYSASLLYRLSLPLMVAGLLLQAWLNTGSVVATLLTNASNIGFELFILITLSEICFKYRIDGIWMFGIMELASSASGVVGWRAGEVFTASYAIGSQTANVVVALIIVGMIGAAVLFFNDRLVSRTFGTEPLSNSSNESGTAVMFYFEDLVWRCTRIARRFGLTHREQEVLELLAQGMSIARIEESLYVSNSTVKTHIRHIYEKMGVHSRDEARKIVDKT
jgi:DNA-binding CsgD family transcriptional regulator